MKAEKLTFILITLYIILFPIKILSFPYIVKKFQPADFIFLTLFALSLLVWRQLKQIKLLNFDIAILFWLFAHGLTCLFHPTRISTLEFIGTFYLTIMYVTINILLMHKVKEAVRTLFFRGLWFSAFFLVLTGIFGLLYRAMGYPNMLIDDLFNFPYFGTVYRMKGLTGQPIMMASIIGVFILILMTEFYSNSFSKIAIWKKVTMVMLIVGLPFTIAKSALITFSCFSGVFMAQYQKKYRYLTIFAFSLILVCYIFVTHFIVINKNIFDNQKDTLFAFLDKSNPILNIGDNYIIKTGYTLLKEKAWFVFTQNPIVGIGAGNLYVEPFEVNNLNYAIIKNFDPHSSYSGTLAEMGIIGFLAFIFIFITALYSILSLLKTELSPRDRQLLYGFSAVFIFMLCEGMATDVMNFRHYWLLFAFFAAWLRKMSINTHETHY